ncbi:uracil-DNA glycosylase [bacterium]|nr:uracil-DNA glycosylase [bacterium]
MTGLHPHIKPMIQSYFRQQMEIYGNELPLSDAGLIRHFLDYPASGHGNDIQEIPDNCQRCALSRSRRHIVVGSGNSNARLMLIGEAPGEEEDRQGRPFVGKAGQLLDKIIAAIGFERQEIYIANILKCRPPGNRDPQPEEIEACVPYLVKQIDQIKPKMILILGRIAAQTLLNNTAPLNQLRGEQHLYHGIPALVTYHPAALLRHAEWKRPVWEDVQRLRHLYDELVGDKGKWKQVRTK